MNKAPVWLRYVALAAWMAVIYRSSATPDLRAVPLIAQLGLLPAGMDPAVVNMLETLLRKGAHMVSFGLVALLAHWSLAGHMSGAGRHKLLLWAFLAAAGYGALDEFHQTFVPTRVGSLTDVLIDCAGAAIALWLVHGRRSR